jgi:hypothetical protein
MGSGLPVAAPSRRLLLFSLRASLGMPCSFGTRERHIVKPSLSTPPAAARRIDHERTSVLPEKVPDGGLIISATAIRASRSRRLAWRRRRCVRLREARTNERTT